MKSSFFILFCLLLFGEVSSQEWGEVSAQELAMTRIEEDPEADAVIFFDKGEIITNSDLEMIFKCYRRMKILTENGKKYADVKITYWHDDDIHKLRAQSISTDGRKTQLDRKAVYDQKIEKWKKKVFAIPGVEVGSVIEYSYELLSKHIHYLPSWNFQNDEYTKLSEVKVYLTAGLTFNTFQENLIYYNPTFTRGEEWDANQRGNRIPTFCWQLTDIPALKSEPYMYNRDDYLAQINFQLVSYKDEYVNYTFIKTWDDMAKVLFAWFEDFLDVDEDLRGLVADITKNDSTEKGKIISIYDFVRSQVSAEDERNLYSNDLKKPGKVVETKKGNRIEKNLLLINLLKNAGYWSNPVFISTRHHGRFKPEFATTSQFDHLLVAVKKEQETIFLDAQDTYCPYSLLPENSLVHQGFLIENDKGKIITIPDPTVQNRLDISSETNLEADGKITLKTNLIYEGYRAITARHQLNKTTRDKYVQDLLNEFFVGAKIDSILIQDSDNIYKPLSITITASIPDYIQTTDKLVYFSLPYLSKIKSNPFKNQKRYFPVDYPYPFADFEKIKIKIPAGYILSELPAKSKMSFQKMSFNLFYFTAENEIEIQRVFKINAVSYPPPEYKNLRQLYDEVVTADQKQVIFSTK
jgi:hypothetical protein